MIKVKSFTLFDYYFQPNLKLSEELNKIGIKNLIQVILISKNEGYYTYQVVYKED